MKKSAVIFDAKKLKPPGIVTLFWLSLFSLLLLFTFQTFIAKDPHTAHAQYLNYQYSQPFVTIQNMQFSPGSMTIPAGTTVTWTNRDSVAHTVTADTNLWDSGIIQPGQSVMMRFTSPGTYSYHCRIHPQMRGQIVVVGTTTAPGYQNSTNQPSASNNYNITNPYPPTPTMNYTTNYPNPQYVASPPRYIYQPVTTYPTPTPIPTSVKSSINQSQNQSQSVNASNGPVSVQQNQSQSQSVTIP